MTFTFEPVELGNLPRTPPCAATLSGVHVLSSADPYRCHALGCDYRPTAVERSALLRVERADKLLKRQSATLKAAVKAARGKGRA